METKFTPVPFAQSIPTGSSLSTLFYQCSLSELEKYEHFFLSDGYEIFYVNPVFDDFIEINFFGKDKPFYIVLSVPLKDRDHRSSTYPYSND